MWHRRWKIVRALFPSQRNGGNLLKKLSRQSGQMDMRWTALVACLGVAACGGGQVPASNPSAGGVGFGNYNTYQTERAARDQQLETRVPVISDEVIVQPGNENQAIASDTLNILDATRPEAATSTGSDPLSVTAPFADETILANNPDISDEQDFDAVSSRESIESDAERLERLRASREVVQPQAIPERPRNTGPNIVEYALSTTNAVGQPIYRRSGRVTDTAFVRACAQFATSDQAQVEFLSRGGPERDGRGLDPDGDGFACSWDPRPFRAARGG